jgi:hypothetical protein
LYDFAPRTPSRASGCFGSGQIKAFGLLKAAGLKPLQEPEDSQKPEAQKPEDPGCIEKPSPFVAPEQENRLV